MRYMRAFRAVAGVLVLVSCGGPSSPVAPGDPSQPPGAPEPPGAPGTPPGSPAPTPTPPPAATGTIEVTVTSSGSISDPDGYALTLNDTLTRSVGTNGSVTFPNVPVGDARLEVGEFVSTCRVTDDNPNLVSVVADSTAAATFHLHCIPAMTRRVVFQRAGGSGPGTDIYSASILPGADSILPDQQLLISDGSDPAVSPDGTRIAFVTRRDGDREIYVASADGSYPVNLTRSAGDDTAPSWSPDGSKIAFASTHGGIFVVDANGGEPVRRTFFGGGSDSSPAWSPDGQTLAFQTNRGGRFNVYTVPAEPDPFGRPCVGPEGCERKRTSYGTNGAALTPTWSTDAVSFIAFAGGSGELRIQLLDPSSGSIEPETPPGRYYDPSYGGDGQLAVTEQSNAAGVGHRVVIFVVDRTLTGSTRVMARTGDGETSDSHPSFSPRS